MEHSDLISYIKTTEDNVKPLKVASGIQGVSLFAKLPRSIQNIVIRKSSNSEPTMSFVVEPYSAFLAFEIIDTAAAATLLPPGYHLLPSSLFSDSSDRPCAIIGAINLHTSLFWGSRLEYYLIAEHESTGLLSWIIVSYETNTSSYDPVRGFTGPTTKHSVVTTTYQGELIVDVESAVTDNRIGFSFDMHDAQPATMKDRLWLEGNLSVDYGGATRNDTSPFSLVFDPSEVSSGYRVDPAKVVIHHNTFGSAYLDSKPFEAAFFPYAQHFVTSSFPEATSMRDAADLEHEALVIARSARGW